MLSFGVWSIHLTEEQGTATLGQCAGRWHNIIKTTSNLSRYTPRTCPASTITSGGNSGRSWAMICHLDCQSRIGVDGVSAKKIVGRPVTRLAFPSAYKVRAITEGGHD